uniref:ABC-type oligopeptide transporter ABCB9 n=1 Tax=Periophthalmus magnuspinnatus TaxID=409849 RepID=A0A3B4BCQ1_9GOBI
MDLRVVVSACGLCVLFDLLLSSLLLTQGFSRGLVPPGLAEMSGLVLALWGCSWLRSSMLIGACLGVMCNRQDGPRRISRSAPAALLVAMVMVTFAVAALLALTEVDSLKNQAWEMGLISWTCISSVGLVLMWRLLGDARDTVRNMNIYKVRQEQRARGAESQRSREPEEQRARGAEKEPEETNSGATLGRLLCYCRKDSGLLTVATLFCEAFIPFFYGVAIDSIVKHQSMELFSRPVLILAALAVASSLAMGVRGGVFTLVFARLNLRLRNHLFRTLMKQEIGFFDKNHTGDLLSRLSADVTQVSDLVSQNLNIFLRSAVKASGFSVFMFRLSWRLSLVSLMGFPFIGLVSQLYGDYYKTLTKEVQSTLAEANRVAEETVSAMRTVRSFANEQGEAESYYSKLLQVFKLNRRQALAYALYMWSSCLSEVALELAVLYYGGHLVVSGQLSSGALISFFIYMLQLGECLESMASVYTGLMQGVGAAEKVFEYLDREPEHSAEQGTEEPDTCSGLVEFRDVTFSYPTRPHTHVLKGVSFTLHPGKVTALVGPSGGGKSSCVSLMENFYLPQSGQVLLDGRPVQSLRHLYLHSKVALVGQEPVLFARSVEENISYGLSHVTKENIERAAREANAHDFICSLHQGYATSVGEKGAQLSGGQKQRVAIARALVRNPRVLILDEATSALDAHSEHMVQQALMSVMKERTVLVVAHRLSSVENADHIVVIVDGRVAEQGTHAELMDRRQVYHRLVQRQVLGLEDQDQRPDQKLDQRPDQRPAEGTGRRRRESCDGEAESVPRL